MNSSNVIDSILSYSQQTEDDYYTIIGCSPTASTGQIMAEYRVKAKLYHPDKILQNENLAPETKQKITTDPINHPFEQPHNQHNPTYENYQNSTPTPHTTSRPTHTAVLNDLSSLNEQFKRLVEAKEVLCDDERRREYDAWRHSGLSLPFKTWKNMSVLNHKTQSMHWAGVAKGPCMLTHPSNCKEGSQAFEGLSSEEMIRRFRNYEI